MYVEEIENRTTAEQLIEIRKTVEQLINYPHEGWNIPLPLAEYFLKMVDVINLYIGDLPKPRLWPQGPDSCSLTWDYKKKSVVVSVFVDSNGREPNDSSLCILNFHPEGNNVTRKEIDLTEDDWPNIPKLVVEHLNMNINTKS